MHPIVLVYSQLDKFAENSFLLARTACARQEMLGCQIVLGCQIKPCCPVLIGFLHRSFISPSLSVPVEDLNPVHALTKQATFHDIPKSSGKWLRWIRKVF